MHVLQPLAEFGGWKHLDGRNLAQCRQVRIAADQGRASRNGKS